MLGGATAGECNLFAEFMLLAMENRNEETNKGKNSVVSGWMTVLSSNSALSIIPNHVSVWKRRHPTQSPLKNCLVDEDKVKANTAYSKQ
jgi:hypothetical protein